MPNENQKDSRKNFAVRYLPWLLGAVMFAVYLITLNPWVTLLNIFQVANVSGWIWQPQVTNPLQFFALLPFHFFPAGKIPMLLNVFSALCASLVLTMLARSIAILPHDRTDTERQRERSDFSFLTGHLAIFPPILAVLLVGLQLTFWENATSYTGESFDLLLFAGVIWQLLEYRLDESVRRLYLVAFIYGAGMAENWSFVAFFPAFVTAIIWLRKLEFFNVRFLGRLFVCGMLGLLFLFFLPLSAKLFNGYKVSFWDWLHPTLLPDWLVIKSLGSSYTWRNLALISLATLLPVFVMSIRWSSNFGDNSRAGTTLVNYLFYFIHAILFTVCVWIMFDPPFSPRQLVNTFPSPFYGASALTLYYLAALSIGYFCGFYLLVFGKKPIRSRRNNNPDPALPRSLMWLCPIIVGGTFAIAIVAVSVLIAKNIPVIHAVNDETLMRYAEYTTQNLPENGAILLSDSDGTGVGHPGQPIHTFLIQAELAREGRSKNYPVLDTQSLNWVPYHRFLHEHFPEQWPLVVQSTNEGGVSPLAILSTLNLLAKSNTICYVNPSFGYYFESFYQEPHGLTYTMKLLPEKNLLPPPLEKNLISENEKFWADVIDSSSPTVEKALNAQKFNHHTLLGWLLLHLHSIPESNQNAVYAGTIYSRALNFWGVQLQRANELDLAATNFIAAQKFNPDNVVAGINLDFNHKLVSGNIPKVDLTKISVDQFGKSRNWQEVISVNGPFDETSYTFQDALILVKGNNLFRQAVAPFNRVHQLDPGNLEARLQLAQIYALNHLPDRVLEVLNEPLTEPEKFSLDDKNSTDMNVIAATAYFQKNETLRGSELLEKEIANHPENKALLTAATQAFLAHGLYDKALRIIDQKLSQTPDDPQWLFGKGYIGLQTGDYHQAIGTLTRVLEIQTNNPTAKFNRALAYLNLKDFDAARADYLDLQTTYSNAPTVAFGLGEIAWQKHDTNEAVRNYKIYLANAPTNTPEATNVIRRLNSLKP